MSQISTNEFKQGLKIVLDKSPCEIIEHEFHKPGKGQAVMRIKYRDLLSNRVLEKTFKTGESVEKAEISSKENRGRLVALYQFNIVLGILIAYFLKIYYG